MEIEGERELAQILRRAREGLSLTQEEAAARARLPLRYIRALEGDQPALVPDESYLIPYLRQYASLLKLPPGELIPLLLSETRQPRVRRPPELASQPRVRRRRWFVAVIVAALASGGFFLSRWHAEQRLRSPLAAPSPVMVFTPAVSASPAASRALEYPETPALDRLTISAREQTWLAVSVDGGPEQTMILQTGEERSWQAKERFTLSVGNAGGVTLTINGMAQPPLGARGEVIRDLRIEGGKILR